MQTFPLTAPGTESSVPGTASPSGNDEQTAVALQNMLAAIATYNQASRGQASGPISPVAIPAVANPIPAVANPIPAAPAPAAAVPAFQTRGPWIVGTMYQVVPTAPLLAIAEDGTDNEDTIWYAITGGHYVGVTKNNALALGAVTGVSRNAMKSHRTQALAVAHFNELLLFRLVQVLS